MPLPNNNNKNPGGAVSWTWHSLQTKWLVSLSPIGMWVVINNNNNNNNNYYDNTNTNTNCDVRITITLNIVKSWKHRRPSQSQASGTTLGFARGNVGFLALGDLGKDFNTGLPVQQQQQHHLHNHLLCHRCHSPQDGEYCDIIRDCSQKIQISGGRGYFQSPDDDPVVAICVGCWTDPTASPQKNIFWLNAQIDNFDKSTGIK